MRASCGAGGPPWGFDWQLMKGVKLAGLWVGRLVLDFINVWDPRVFPRPKLNQNYLQHNQQFVGLFVFSFFLLIRKFFDSFGRCCERGVKTMLRSVYKFVGEPPGTVSPVWVLWTETEFQGELVEFVRQFFPPCVMSKIDHVNVLYKVYQIWFKISKISVKGKYLHLLPGVCLFLSFFFFSRTECIGNII